MGKQADKELRVRTGTNLLRRIKENGGTAAEVAKFLGISATTMSHWQSGSKERLKRVGAPTDAQLQRMIGYLCARIKSNNRNLLDFVVGGVIRHKEQMLLLKSLGPEFGTINIDWEKSKDAKEIQIDSFISRLKEYHKNNPENPRPQEYWEELQRYCGHMKTLPSQEDISEGVFGWDYDNLKLHMQGFDEGVRAIENLVEDLQEGGD